jgi:hypothetical protein
MVRLPKSLAAWGTPAFEDVLKQELEALDSTQLSLQQGLTTTSHATDQPIQVMVLGASEVDGRIRVRVGVFFSGIIAGCSCADDPTPVEAQQEYCELEVDIDQASGATTFVPTG